MYVMGFSIDLEDLNLNDKDKEKSPQALIFEVIHVIIMQYAQTNQGLNEEERRKFYKLSDVFEAAIKDEALMVELEDDYTKFLKMCRSKAKLLPNKLTQRVEALMDGLKEKKEPEPESETKE